jgi:hypothetical protein
MGQAARWVLASPVRSFDASEAAERWTCGVETATEIIFGPDGFVERGYVVSLNGNGNGVVLVTDLGIEVAAMVEALA